MILFDKKTPDGKSVYYNTTEDGFDIYIGSEGNLVYTQHEPFIPDHSKTYEENAIQMCEELSKVVEHHDYMGERITNIESNIDYLMLLNDPDSATEE